MKKSYTILYLLLLIMPYFIQVIEVVAVTNEISMSDSIESPLTKLSEDDDLDIKKIVKN